MQTLTTPWVPAKSNLNPENANSHTVHPPSDLQVLGQVVPFLFCFACRLSKCVSHFTCGNIRVHRCVRSWDEGNKQLHPALWLLVLWSWLLFYPLKCFSDKGSVVVGRCSRTAGNAQWTRIRDKLVDTAAKSTGMMFTDVVKVEFGMSFC